jgi:hypothetical protein
MRIDSTLQLLTTVKFIASQIISLQLVSSLAAAICYFESWSFLSSTSTEYLFQLLNILLPHDLFPWIHLFDSHFCPASMRFAPSRSPPPRCLNFLNKHRKHFLLLVVLKRTSLPNSFCSWESVSTSHSFSRRPNMQLGIAALNQVKALCREYVLQQQQQQQQC